MRGFHKKEHFWFGTHAKPTKALGRIINFSAFETPYSGYAHGEILGSTAAPSLSELVEACGEPFRSLTKRHTAQWDWWASAYANGAVACGGKTADEAAAKLWLALNAKGV